MNLMEVVYFLQNKPYFKVYVVSKGRRIKKFIQLAASTKQGESFFIVCKSLKAAWFKPDGVIIDGLKFIVFVDINNAIPLKFDKEYRTTDNEYYIKEEKIITIKEDVEKQLVNKKKTGKTNDGKPIRLVEISYPPQLLHQQVEAHFIDKVLSIPPSKWEELKWVFIVAILGLIFIAWNIINSGGLKL